ncbi:MAG: DUF1161 domain-containing protein [Pantoea sp.]|uniref:DUF1161 domain-containing protein n=1 Tax=Pantoea phytobeneficialis TaxID=2052056 RepID=A0AAP9H5I7_9GAMM|nr:MULTISPECIES: DUF1161 domain-containing protein [Pantoea]ERK17557.1 hypothetical protein L579_3437 [Pantoea sp. AS-PWVM4]MDO6405570.1 DUF1161 domain-containing protein [Pantoea phytobeneficialis]QGR06782.1 DUF1161 domain-containing protein [Pantoea phytobeneficialis]
MKKRLAVMLLSLLALPMLAQASCESVKAEISKKLVSNGLAESDFTLEIVPNDQADQAGGQVVGHCENDTQKIVYKKLSRDAQSNVPNDAGSSHDTPQ